MTASDTSGVAPATRARPRWLSALIVVLVVAIVVAAGSVWWVRAHRRGISFTAVFAASVGIYPGSDVRILGVPVGTVDTVTPQGRQVLIGMHVDPGITVRADTYAVIVSPTLVGDRFVQLTGVYSSGPKLKAGAQIPRSYTRTPVELDQLYTNLISLTDAFGPHGANRSGALNQLLVTAAANLKGNGAAVNTTISQLSKASAAFGGSKDHIASTLSQLASFTQMLKQNNQGVVAINDQLAAFSQTLADDRNTFAEAIQDLGSALGLVQQFVRDNRAKLTADVTALNRVATTLAGERDGLTELIKTAPLLVQNFLNAYDPKHNVLRGRVDLNEIGAWAPANDSGSVGSDAVPALLPSTGTSP